LPFENLKTSLALEFAGTFFLVFGAASTAVLSYYLVSWMNPFVEHVLIAVTVGVVVSLSILLFGSKSGAIINPAITVSFALAGTMPRRYLVPYVAAQLLASLLAGVCLWILFHSLNSPTHLGSTKIQEGATPISGTILEIAGTVILSFAAIVATTASSLKENPRKQSLLVGLVIFFLTVVIGPFTGASFNPSRSLGPALASGFLRDQYVYLVGPLAGGILAAIIFSILKRRGEEKGREERGQQHRQLGTVH
jgi:glycerol uptake facilitator-like aquaporin